MGIVQNKIPNAKTNTYWQMLHEVQQSLYNEKKITKSLVTRICKYKMQSALAQEVNSRMSLSVRSDGSFSRQSRTTSRTIKDCKKISSFNMVIDVSGYKDVLFSSLPFGQAVAKMY